MMWYTADLHFGHVNIIDYCNRPYRTVEEMNAGIVERWNAQVAEYDVVHVVGDLCMGQLADSLTWVDRLHGQILLTPGNHDPVWAGCGEKRRDKWRAEYERRLALQPERWKGTAITGDGGLTRVDICHFPFVGHDHRDFDEWRPADEGQWLIHGHVHDLYRQHDRQINVGFDAWGGRLVHVDQLNDLVMAGPNRLDALDWTET